jgi:hypothetical protein
MAREGAVRPLKSLVGEMIIVRTPAIDEYEMKLVRLHGVEPSGIWIESQDFTEQMMKKCKVSTSITTLLLFVPFHHIDFIVGRSFGSVARQSAKCEAQRRTFDCE